MSPNYSCSNFNFLEQEAFSIGYKNNNPFLFSTIFRRPQWPIGAYRILNRTWKVNRQSHVSKSIDQIFNDPKYEKLPWFFSKQKWDVKNSNIVVNTFNNELDKIKRWSSEPKLYQRFTKRLGQEIT